MNIRKIILVLVSIMSAFATAYSQDADLSSNIQAIFDACPTKPAVVPQTKRKVLMFSRTCGYRHKVGIPAAKITFAYMAKTLGICELVISDELENFTPEKLKQFDCIILNNSTGMCFGENHKKLAKMPDNDRKTVEKRSKEICKNVIDYVRNGGSILAIHAGVDCYNRKGFIDDEYTGMLGADFVAHPWYFGNLPVEFVIDDKKSPLVEGIWDGERFKIKEEVYLLGKAFDRTKSRVVMRIDAQTSPIKDRKSDKITYYHDGDYATTFIKSFGKGRIAYSTIGHYDNNYYDAKVQEMYMRLLQFCCGDLKADTTPIPLPKK